MPTYQAFDPKSEIIGRTALSMTTSIMHEDIEGILERHGLKSIDPEAWYLVQSLLNVMNEVISGGVNASPIFVSIGMAAARLSLEAMPPQLKALPWQTFFASYDKIWQSRHRNGDVGHVVCEQVDDHHLILRFRSPYPDDIFYGAFYTYARHFKPEGMSFKVAYDEKLLPRDRGGDETVIHSYVEG